MCFGCFLFALYFCFHSHRGTIRVSNSFQVPFSAILIACFNLRNKILRRVEFYTLEIINTFAGKLNGSRGGSRVMLYCKYFRIIGIFIISL